MEKSAITPETKAAFVDIGQQSIYLMGTAFILGSLFTIFLLLVLDFMRRNKTNKVS